MACKHKLIKFDKFLASSSLVTVSFAKSTQPMAVISPVKVPQATWDVGMAGVARRAAWLPGENAKSKCDGAVRFSLVH